MTKKLETVPKLNVIYFNSDHTNTPKFTGKIAEEIDLSWTLVSTWGELSSALQIPEAILAVSIDMMNKEPVKSVLEFMDALYTLTKFMPCHNRLKIGVVIKNTTPRSVIKDLQRTQCQGILLYIRDYSISEVNTAMKALGSGIPYWPQHIIEKLPTGLPLSIYFRQDWNTYITPEIIKYVKQQEIFEVAYCADWSDLDRALKQRPHQLIFHISMLKRLGTTIPEIMSMLTIKLKLANLDIPVAVGIDPNINQLTIKELKRAGVFGLVFSYENWGVEETARGMVALRDRVPYWPKHMIDQLPSSVKKKPNANNIVLTSRQDQVFKYVTERGSSNKSIAKAMGISESTVKLHLTEIFKKYGVRNRTQLAVFSQS